MRDYSELYRHVDDQADRYLDMLKTLISQPSVSATGEGLRECGELVKELLMDVGMRVETWESEVSGPAVLAEVNAEAHATIMFYNHYDVQPPDPLERWETDPFTPSLRNGRLYGRGAADNKGNIAARLAAVDTVLATLGELPVNIKFVIEGGEEVGSPDLEKFALENKEKLFADGCIWEYGYVDRRGSPVINLGVKGMLYVELESHGIEIHSSWGGIVENPAWKLVYTLSRLRDSEGRILLEDFYTGIEEVDEAVEELLEKIDLESIMPESVKPRSVGRSMVRRLLLEPACNLCGISSGYTGAGSKTSIPQSAKARIDFRLVPGQSPERIFQTLQKHLEPHHISARRLHGYPAARTPPTSYLAGLVSDTAREVYRVEPTLIPISPASGPMYVFTDLLGVPCVSTGVGYLGSNVHGPNENIRVEDFIKGVKHIALILCNFHSYLS
jgi:acetylornithine deacetylase/succinyl-diaminopimelate desuccinylase-like protein